MNSNSESSDHQLLALLQSVRDAQDDSARAELNELLRNNPSARAAMARLLVDEQALISRLRDDSIVSLLEPAMVGRSPAPARSTGWRPWRPLTATAAGLLLGMFFSSVVFGFVATRIGVVKRMPLAFHSPGFEDTSLILDDGLPHRAGQWGADSAAVVLEEYGVQPAEGQRMMRLEPIPRQKDVKNHASRAYQVVDLRSLVIPNNEEAEVQMTASFFASNSDIAATYRIRGVTLNEIPDQAMKEFWSKTDNDDAVSVSQKFETLPGDRRWHTFSVKMPLQHGAKTLVLIFAAMPPGDMSSEGSVHYLDDVQVSVFTSPQSLP